MKCKNCGETFDIEHAIEASDFSWPKRQTIWYVCSQCGKGNHMRFDEGLVQIVIPQGSPGYEYEVVSTVSDPTIKIRIDPEFLHVWYMGRHYEIKERA